MDPFAELELPAALELDKGELERRFVALSRDSHPDRHRDAGADEQIAVLERSARLNDAYRVLRDRWRRAEALLELREPGVMDATKKLDPMFLGEAMELAEEVAEAGADAATALRARLGAEIEADWTAIGEAAATGDWRAAATRLHQSRYRRKALADLPD